MAKNKQGSKSKVVSLTEIALQAAVSRMTASRVLRGADVTEFQWLNSALAWRPCALVVAGRLVPIRCASESISVKPDQTAEQRSGFGRR